MRVRVRMRVRGVSTSSAEVGTHIGCHSKTTFGARDRDRLRLSVGARLRVRVRVRARVRVTARVRARVHRHVARRCASARDIAFDAAAIALPAVARLG